jgi:hypothetical protein
VRIAAGKEQHANEEVADAHVRSPESLPAAGGMRRALVSVGCPTGGA